MTEPLQVGFGLDELRAAITSGRLFLTVGEFSEFYRCDERTARRGVERGEVPAVRVGSIIRIPVAALLRMAGLEPDDHVADSTQIDLANSEAVSATDTAARSDLRHLKAIMAILTRTEAEGKHADQARLVALIERQLGGPVRCHDCGRPLHAFRSLLGRGPTCRRKRRSGGVS